MESANQSEQRASRHLELACTHVLNSWFPANRSRISELSSGLRQNIYKDRPQEFLAELRKDFALYTHCIKKLVELRQSKLKHHSDAVDPVALITCATREELLQVLGSGNVSDHSLDRATPAQALRLQQSVTSATCAETLSEKCHVNGDSAYSCALFRQLGLTLVAWNYPHVYQRVSKSLKDEETIESALARILGFSPKALALNIAQKWGISPDLRCAMGDTSVIYSNDSARQAGETLSHLCEIGEALARASDPEHYPSAADDMETAKHEIERVLGTDGLALIQSKISDNLKQYAAALPELFSEAPKLVDTQAAPAAANSAARLRDNHYAKYCAPLVQEYLRELYRDLQVNTVSRKGIETLVKQVIPAAGFERGCIYLIEPDSMLLMPRLAIGTTNLQRYTAVNCSNLSAAPSPIAAAYRSNIPTMEINTTAGNETISWIAGVLGDLQKAGVLYLEISDKVLNLKNSNPMAYFKAMRQALMDCLGIK